MDFFQYSFMSLHDMWLLGTVFLCLLILADDSFVDFLAFVTKAEPHRISKDEYRQMNDLKQKKIAILIANWKEEQVLERMVAGNIRNIDYKLYDLFLGVYPNDKACLEAALRVQNQYVNVKVVINTLNGPTSKGQMINQMVTCIDGYNKTNPDSSYDLIMTQDAEDVMHRYSLKLINLRAQAYDFIQIPVFSLPTALHQLTAGVYIDEFTDSHTKHLLVRDRCDAGIPSAGVGTAVSQKVVGQLLKLQNGQFLKENALTEDYFLGLTCFDLNIKAHFASEYLQYIDKKTGKSVHDFIATREYFPQKIKASIKQKTRWIMGICLQGFEQAPRKSKHFFASYFLWRDRKGLLSAPVFVSTLLFAGYFLVHFLVNGSWLSLDHSPYNYILYDLMWINLFFSCWRVLQRIYSVKKVYGYAIAALVPLRWLLSNFINNVATFNAVYKWSAAKIKGEVPKWVKTEHIIPKEFGLTNVVFLEDAKLKIK